MVKAVAGGTSRTCAEAGWTSVGGKQGVHALHCCACSEGARQLGQHGQEGDAQDDPQLRSRAVGREGTAVG